MRALCLNSLTTYAGPLLDKHTSNPLGIIFKILPFLIVISLSCKFLDIYFDQVFFPLINYWKNKSSIWTVTSSKETGLKLKIN